MRCIKRFQAELLKDGGSNGARLVALCSKTRA